VVDQILGQQLCAVSEDDDRVHGLTPGVVRNSDYSALRYGRMLDTSVLDFNRVDVLALMTMSLIRSTTYKKPSVSIRPASPV
jgi:hypothetical protein